MKDGAALLNQLRADLSQGQPDIYHLVESCVASYDGVYTLSAPSGSFPALARSYPELARYIFTATESPLRLRLLDPTLNPVENEVESAKDPGKANHPKASKVPDEATADSKANHSAFTLHAGASTVTDAILQRESIVAVPNYLLRFVPYTGADAVLVAIALRQAFYRYGKARGADQNLPKAGDKVSLEVERILKMLGGCLSRASFFRLLKDGKLDSFVTKIAAGHQVVKGQVKRLPNEYQYRGNLLTPGDASDLADFLEASGLQENPAQALAAALETPRSQILQFPYRLPKAKGERITEAVSVPELLRLLLPEQRLNPELLGLAEALSSALIRPESFTGLPWYWFRKVLPEMGSGLGALYLMAKACGFTDWAGGQDRDRFWVPGGETALQAWVGSKSLPRMIPSSTPSGAGRPRQSELLDQSSYVRSWRDRVRELASPYLQRTQTRPSKDGSGSDWQLWVGQTSLIPADETLRDAVFAFLCAASDENGLLKHALLALQDDPAFQNALLAAARTEAPQAGLSEATALSSGLPVPGICHFETLKQLGICHFDTLSEEAFCHFETLRVQLNCYYETLVAAGICKFDTVIQILLRLNMASFFRKDITNTLNSAPESDEVPAESISANAHKAVAEEAEAKGEEFSTLLAKIDPRKASEIRQRNLQQRFVAWVIYGVKTETVRDPLNLAVAKTLLEAQVPDPACQALADLGEEALLAELEAGQNHRSRGYLGGWAAQTEGSLQAFTAQQSKRLTLLISS